MDSKAREDLKKGFIESYFFYPKLWHKCLALLLLPISFLYALIAIFRKSLMSYRAFDLKIISIGNLVSGGSGKTPFCIALVQHLQQCGYKDIYVILRGYKRKSKGLVQVSNQGTILCNVAQSGDEAMLIAIQTTSSVIVSEDRTIALNYAKNNNAKIVILDDAYRFNFNKFDILLEPLITPYFPFVLPSGYYRFPKSFYKKCDLHIKEGASYVRKVQICYPQLNVSVSQNGSRDFNIQDEKRFILATAIANPSRLQPFLPQNIIHSYYLPDHASFTSEELQELLCKYNATHILMTQKDYVKCSNFDLPFALLMLNIEIDSKVLDKIKSFLQKS